MKYTLGLYEKALPDTLSMSERLALARESGYDFVELSVDESDSRLARLMWTPTERETVRRAALDAGMPLLSICLSGHRKYPLGSHDAQVRTRSLEIMEQTLDLALDLGVRTIQLAGYDVYYEEGDDSTRAWFRENLQKCIEMAAAARVVLGFETMETAFMDTVAKAMIYVQEANSPYLQIYPDIGNLTNAAQLYGHNVLTDLEAGAGHLCALHLKETLPGQYRNLRFGDGHVDFDAAVEKAAALGVRSFVAEQWYLGDEDWREELQRSAAWLRERLECAMP